MVKGAIREGTDEFAQWFYAERKRRRQTQAEIEHAIGAVKGMVSRWERGHNTPSPKYVYALGQYWGTDVDWMLSKIGYRPAETPRDEPSSALANLIHLLEEVELNDERTAHLTFVLENMKRVDDAARTTTPTQLAITTNPLP